MALALGLASQLMGGLLRAPAVALAPVDIRTCGAAEARAIHGADPGPGTTHWIAARDGTPVGALSVRGDTLQALHVLPAWRRRGIGRALLQAAVGARDEALQCEAPPEGAAFLEACGWVRDGPVWRSRPALTADGG